MKVLETRSVQLIKEKEGFYIKWGLGKIGASLSMVNFFLASMCEKHIDSTKQLKAITGFQFRLTDHRPSFQLMEGVAEEFSIATPELEQLLVNRDWRRNGENLSLEKQLHECFSSQWEKKKKPLACGRRYWIHWIANSSWRIIVVLIPENDLG